MRGSIRHVETTAASPQALRRYPDFGLLPICASVSWIAGFEDIALGLSELRDVPWIDIHCKVAGSMGGCVNDVGIQRDPETGDVSDLGDLARPEQGFAKADEDWQLAQRFLLNDLLDLTCFGGQFLTSLSVL